MNLHGACRRIRIWKMRRFTLNLTLKQTKSIRYTIKSIMFFGERDELCEYMAQGEHEFTYTIFRFESFSGCKKCTNAQ